MRLVVLAVGAPRDRRVAATVGEYESRIARYFRFEAIEVSTGSAAGKSPLAVREREAELLRRRIPEGLDTWALTRDAAQVTSRGLADTLGEMATYGHAGIAFIIGGAFGLDERLVRDCTATLSLSNLTLPHDLARLLLTEQLYRAGTILRGEPYHKGGAR